MKVEGFYVPVSGLLDAFRAAYREGTGRLPSKRTLQLFLQRAHDASPVRASDGQPMRFDGFDGGGQ